jgi:vancomycin aglycone glucosyltransferase
MKVLLSSIGSRGDVQPILALARTLLDHGHTARLCVAPNFKAWVESFGIECVPIGPDLQRFTLSSGATPPTPGQMQAMAEQSVRSQFEAIRDAASGCDAIVAATALQIASRSIAELLDIPYAFTAYAPNVFPSADLMPARTMPGRVESVPVTDHRALWSAEGQRWNARFLRTLNDERAKLGFAPVDDIMRHIFGDTVWLAADRVLGPAPANADLGVVQTGAWFMRDDAPLSDDLQRFLDAGEPPIYFGFGSMRGADQTARTLIDAARALGRRAIFLQGWGNLTPIDAGADCIGIGDVDHAKLFERVAVVVHHGGAGTTHAAARAGAAQVILPHNYDQFYWSARVQELGIGAAGPTRSELTTDALVAALRVALEPETARRAKNVAGQMEQNGAAIAAEKLIASQRGAL